ncbi:MAG: C10 family peptidase [Bacteroidaceae bacterium]|nr:C10 family peptidase [Bacteroidaceae bacterium]
MHAKALLISLFAMLPLHAKPQVRITHDGALVAHGVEVGNVVPPLLRTRLAANATVAHDGPLPRPTDDATPTTRRHIAPPAADIGPLLRSVRDQKEPFNWMCPRWTNDDGRESEERCLTGCVATCIEQLMAYHRHPQTLADTLHGWQTDHYTIPDMLPGTRFDWDNYLDDYRHTYSQAEGEAVALVSLAAGMAVNMSYGLEASGASLWRAPEALRKALAYGMVRVYDRVLYSPERWHALLRHELEQGRPVAYAAHTMALSGHAFNIDGVNRQGFYHVNWGYDGSYDGWYDLEWLDPWERHDHPADGIAMGFFTNHSMLVMHPSADARPLEADTFRLDSLGVSLNAIRLARPAVTGGYVAADFDFANTSRDTVTYTYEVMSFLPTDTAVFLQADYVGLSTITLRPGEQRTQRAYLQFTTPGERLLGISHDDVTIPYTQPVSVAQATAPQRLEWGKATMTVAATEATVAVTVANSAAAGVAGDLVTHCLRPDGADEDMRHYSVLALDAGADTTLTVAFTHLLPDTRYTYRLRCPWAVQAEISFTTLPPDGIRAILPGGNTAATTAPRTSDADTPRDLTGRKATAASRIVVANGRKHLNHH